MYSLADHTAPGPTQLSDDLPAPVPARGPEPSVIELVLAEAVLVDAELEPAHARAQRHLESFAAFARAHWHAAEWRAHDTTSVGRAIAALTDPTAPHNGENR
jgi:hypothetical protein